MVDRPVAADEPQPYFIAWRPNGEVLGFVRGRAGADVKGDANLDVKAKVQTSAGATAS